jgi:hypothetical protein
MAQSEGFDQNPPHPHARGGTNDSAAENAIKILAAKEKKSAKNIGGRGNEGDSTTFVRALEGRRPLRH